MKSNFVELVLTCGSWQEAQALTDLLLASRVVNTAELLETGTALKVHILIGALEQDIELIRKCIVQHSGLARASLLQRI